MGRVTYTKNGVTIDGGELQPWLTYTDENGEVKEIMSYASWIYASNGSQFEDVTEGHAPIFAALHLQDDFSTYSNEFGELTGCLDDIPSFYVVVDLGHTFAYGPDYYYGYDTYQAMFDFANYYLRGDAVKVVYTSPIDKTGDVDTTSSFTVKFSGAVPETEITKVKLTAAGSDTAIAGTWSYVRGKTEWTFTPSAALAGDTDYTLTVPTTLAGDNGKTLASEYTAGFHTEAEATSEVQTVTTSKGTYFILTAPTSTAADARIRFYASDSKAANVAGLYAVSGFDVSSPDSSTVGSLVGSVNLEGAGFYEIDVTDEILGASGEVVFLLKAEKATASTSNTIAVSSASIGAYSRSNGKTVTDPKTKEQAYGFYVNENVRTNGSNQYAGEVFYANNSTLLTVNNIFGSSVITNNDLGRRYTVTMRVYDEASRVIQLKLNGAATAANSVTDFDRVYYNFATTANEWATLSFEYVVYEPHYGTDSSTLAKKSLTIMLGTTGASELPIYIGDITVTETVTEVVPTSASLALGSRGSDFVSSSAESPFAIGSTGYDTLALALAAAKTGETVKMQKNYTLTSSDSFTGWEKLASITLDLGGYKLTAKSGKSPIVANATSTSVPKTAITITNGDVYLYDSPLVFYSGATAGSGKTFDITLDSVKLMNGQGSSLYNLLSATTVSAVTELNVNINLVDTDIDFRKAYNTNNKVTLMPVGTGSLNLSYTVNGGSIYFDKTAATAIVGSPKSVEFTADASGNYTAFYTSAATDVSSLAFLRDDGFANLNAATQANNIVTYNAVTSELSTMYGFIPEAYADVDAWPFVMFDENGNFKGAYNCWLGDNGSGSVLAAARNYVVNAWNGSSYGTNPKEAFVYMRRNYTFDSSKDKYYDNLAQLQGTVNIDLGGYTLENAADVKYKNTGTIQGIFPAYSKGYSGAAGGNPIFPTTVRVTNGALRTYNGGIVQAMTWDSVGGGAIAGKDFNFIFDKVTIGFTDIPGGAGLVLHRMTNSSTVAAPYNLTFNDCVIDTTTSKTSHSCTIFKLNAPISEYVQANYTVNGGKIITDGVSTITIADSTSTHGSSIVFGKGSDGKYTSYYIPESSTKTVAVGDWDATNGDTLGFVANGTGTYEDASYKVYTLAVNPLVTDYGMISDTYASVDDYPFVVFYSDGTQAGYKYLLGVKGTNGVLNAVKVYFDDNGNSWNGTAYTNANGEVITATILMRRDYKLQTITYNNTEQVEYFDNLAQLQGTVTLDMGGFNLYENDTYSMGFIFDTVAKGWSGGKNTNTVDGVKATSFPSTLIIKDGTFNLRKNALFHIGNWSNASITDKLWTLQFDGVTFALDKGATITNLIGGYFKHNSVNSTYGAAPYDITFNDCTFDLKTNAPTSAFTLFQVGATEAWMIDCDVVVNGGTVLLNSMTNVTPYQLTATNTSSIVFGKGSDGEYLKLSLASGAAYPAHTLVFTDDNGKVRTLLLETTENSCDIYELALNFTTSYGDAPARFESVSDYPVLLFKTDKSFVGGYAGWKAAITSINTSSSSYNMWVRADITETESTSVANFRGNLTIDLDGHTLTSKRYGLDIYANDTSNATTTDVRGSFTIKNGFIHRGFNTTQNNAYPFICINYNAATHNRPVSYTFAFEGVTFSGERTNCGIIFDAWEDKANTVTDADASVISNVTFTDCTFNVADSTDGAIFLKLAGRDGYDRAIFNVDIIGGNIKADTAITLADISTVNGDENGRADALNIINGSDGKYITLTLPETAAAPATSSVWTGENGEELVMVKLSNADGFTTYRLIPKAVATYVPKQSITLWSDFIFNVYVPTENLTGVKLDGKTVELNDSMLADVNGVSCYKLTVNLGAQESLRDIVLNVTLEVDGNSFNGMFTLNTLKYAKKIIGTTAEAERSTEQKLVCDMLSYARAAYAYFTGADRDGAAAKLAEIDTILGENYDADNAPAFAGSEAVPTEGLLGAALVLDATPAIRFYIPESADACAYSFYADGRKLEGIEGADGNGRYIELDVYAYAMCKTITYTVGDVSGSYHINSYYAFAKSQGDTSLITLVERFAKYCESAEDYRKEVTSK